MTQPNQMKTFCLHLAAQVLSKEHSERSDLVGHAQDIVTAAQLFEGYLLDDVENDVGFKPDFDLLSFKKPDDDKVN